METKKCIKCNEEKSITEFRKHKQHKDGYDNTCKECNYGHKPHKLPTEFKICTICGETKQIDDFSLLKKDKPYRQGECKVCKNKKKDVMRRTTGKEKNKKLKQVFGITIDDYNKILEQQENKCKICGKEAKTLNKNLSVDHCHATGKIRGLLCTHCNSLLGFALDNTSILENAIKYLKEQ